MMHTMMKENDRGEFIVGRFEVDVLHGSAFVPMFHGMSAVSAIQLVNTLNGGEFQIDSLRAAVLPKLWVG